MDRQFIHRNVFRETIVGWGSTFQTTECKTTDIPKFQILKERNINFSIFLFSNVFFIFIFVKII